LAIYEQVLRHTLFLPSLEQGARARNSALDGHRQAALSGHSCLLHAIAGRWAGEGCGLRLASIQVVLHSAAGIEGRMAATWGVAEARGSGW
jgi:hypothetical protein